MSNDMLRPLRIAVFFALLIPAAMLAHDYWTGALASPFRTIVQETGTWSIRMLVLGLMITPLRDITGWTWPLALRRMIGLYAAFYAHAPPNSDYGRSPEQVTIEHLDELGLRPVGFCGR